MAVQPYGDPREQPGQGLRNDHPLSFIKYLLIKYPWCDGNVLETMGEKKQQNSRERDTVPVSQSLHSQRK